MVNNFKILLENKKVAIMRRNFLLNENIKVKRTQPLGGGYWIILTSDLQGEVGSKETAMMGKILKMTKADVWERQFQKPTYFKDRSTGVFGWGYFIGPNTTDVKSQEYLSNLKGLVRDFNVEKQLEADTEVEGITLNQMEQITQIVQRVEQAAEETANQEVKNNLEKYLDDLQKSVENDEVFEFLIENFEKAKTFQKRNSGWKYSILNALIVITGDPTAEYAGPRVYWDSRNYQIKPELDKKGIFIFKPKTSGKSSDVDEKAKYFKSHPEALGDFKKEMGIGDQEKFSLEDPKNKYQLAMFATKKGYLRKSISRFERTMVYTNNMVEPIPGKETMELGDLYFTDTKEEFQENIVPLFEAVLSIAQKDGVPIPTNLTADKTNVNNFSKALYAVALKKVTSKFGGEKKKSGEDLEFMKIQAESISHIVKRHYGVKSESSKYNIASWGGDKQKLQATGNFIIKAADDIINKIDALLTANKPNVEESYDALRKVIKNVLSSYYV
jgi:hypothetical protein